MSRRQPRLDRARLRRVRGFVLGVLLHALFWDVVLTWPLLRRLRRPPLERWRAIARRYRALAVELGGVLIKLGQFLSTRVDILPREITSELAALQDKVPPAPFALIRAQVEEDFGRPLEELFAWFSAEAVGAASLAQVHAARLGDGEDVVVKVLRPGIAVLVETDLAALATALRWLRLAPLVHRRVDLAWLEREFRTVTREELDTAHEGRNAERFANDHAEEPGVVIPRVYWSHTGAHTLTLANVGYTRIGNLAALDGLGIDRRELARFVYRLTMRQLFVTHFVHADPHPGNIFVRKAAAAPGFEVAYVDFGMMTAIPERLRAAMREFLLGLGTRDARRMVHALGDAGALLPGADIERLTEGLDRVLARFWGVRLADLRDLAFAEAPALLLEFRDLVLAAPIQVQADMLFTMRAIGIVAGLCTTLDPEFDPWSETLPFAERVARGEERGLSGVLEEIGLLAGRLLKAPAQVERLLERAERGTLGVQASLSDEARLRLTRLERATNRLAWTVAAGSLLLGGVVLRAADRDPTLSLALLAAAAVSALIALLRRPPSRTAGR